MTTVDASTEAQVGFTLLKRSEYVLFYLEEGNVVDLETLLHGDINYQRVRSLYALSILTGTANDIGSRGFAVLSSLAGDAWIELDAAVQVANVTRDALLRMALQGLVVTNGEAPELARLRDREEGLASQEWNLYAAFYHFMTRWRDVRVDLDVPDDPDEWPNVGKNHPRVLQEFVTHYGPPPSHIHQLKSPSAIVDLPLVTKQGDLYRTLERRKTVRGLDATTPLPMEQLSVLLRYTFGWHGYLRVLDDAIAVRRTSPSGGALHPCEVYPLLIRVDEVDSGLYHYDAGRHSLEQITRLTCREAEEWADEFTAGQAYPKRAQALFIITARFYRNYWKYRRHQKAYSVVLMDAAHLSQTFLLVATDLGLGPFLTAAINNEDIDRRLGLDGVSEGALLICGCGEPVKGASLDPVFEPYIPRETNIG